MNQYQKRIQRDVGTISFTSICKCSRPIYTERSYANLQAKLAISYVKVFSFYTLLGLRRQTHSTIADNFWIGC